MRQGLLACWIYCCCASGGVTYKVTETASACQEVRIPKWTKPKLQLLERIDTNACEYSFRSPNGSAIYLGLICKALYSGRAQEKYALDFRSAGGARLLSEAEWEAADPLWPNGSSGPTPQAGGIEYLGHLFPKSGPKWPEFYNSALSPGSRRVAVYSWDGVIEYCTDGPFNCFIWDQHFHGDYWIDLFDVPSATRLIQIRGKFRGIDPDRLQGKSVWPNSRYFVVPVEPKGMRHLLLCDLDAAAAAHGMATDRASIPKTSSFPRPNLLIQDEPLWARFSGLKDEAVIDPKTGNISAVEFKVSLNVRVARRYRLVIRLCPGLGPCMAQPKFLEQQAEEDLHPGPAQIKLSFAADTLRVLGQFHR